MLVSEWWATLFPLTCRETIHLRQRDGTVIWSRTVTFAGRTAKKVSKLGKTIDKVSLLKLVEEDREFYPVSVIVDCFGVKRSTFYRWKARGEQSEERDEIVEKIEQPCMEISLSTAIVLSADYSRKFIVLSSIVRKFIVSWRRMAGSVGHGLRKSQI